MKDSKMMRVLLIVVAMLLALDVGARLLMDVPTAKAEKKVEYKVVSKASIKLAKEPKTYEEEDALFVQALEKTLNDMAGQGWVLDSVVPDPNRFIFRR